MFNWLDRAIQVALFFLLWVPIAIFASVCFGAVIGGTLGTVVTIIVFLRFLQEA